MGSPIGRKGPRPSIRHHAPRRQRGSRYIPLIIIVSLIGVFMQVVWVEKNKDKFIDQSVVMMLKKMFRSQIFSIACPHCGGDGLIPDSNGEDNKVMCPVCFGLGIHDIRLVEKADAICTQCGGLGRIANPGGTTAHLCTNCAGRGVIHQMPIDRTSMKNSLVKIECDECGGNGVVRHKDGGARVICPLCFGLGSHTSRRINETDSLCPACAGIGRLYDPETGEPRNCRRCNGRGLIEDEKTP